MTAESTSKSELTEFVANHIFCNVNRDEFVTVMHCNGTLFTLMIGDNHLDKLAIQNCNMLTDVYAAYNDLTAVSFENCPKLMWLDFEWNDLESFTLTGQSTLQRVNLANNQLNEVNLSFNPNLQYVNVANNELLNSLILDADTNVQQVVGEYDDWGD